jgi:hypothetical protein
MVVQGDRARNVRVLYRAQKVRDVRLAGGLAMQQRREPDDRLVAVAHEY